MTGTTREEPKLLPCPFCGSEAEIERRGSARQSTIYRCTNCSCSLETGEVFNIGDRWNMRENPAPSPSAGREEIDLDAIRSLIKGAIEAAKDPSKPAYLGRNLYDEEQVGRNWTECQSALDNVSHLLSSILEDYLPADAILALSPSGASARPSKPTVNNPTTDAASRRGEPDQSGLMDFLAEDRKQWRADMQERQLERDLERRTIDLTAKESDGGGENRRPAKTGNMSGAAPEAEQSSPATSFVRADEEGLTSQARAGVAPGPSDPSRTAEAMLEIADHIDGKRAAPISLERCKEIAQLLRNAALAPRTVAETGATQAQIDLLIKSKNEGWARAEAAEEALENIARLEPRSKDDAFGLLKRARHLAKCALSAPATVGEK